MLGGDNYSMIQCPMAMERSTGKWRCTNTESAPNCPRCASTNTKFCYYNNYSLSQPRYFCKGCRRYWTKGGSLRNVPVGGGCRKSRRTRASRLAGSPNNYSAQTLARQRGASGSAGGGATDIDLAAVFARYVSQNVGENDVSGSPGGSSGSSENNPAGVSEIDCQYLDDVTMLEYQTPLDLMNGGEDQVIPGGTMMNGQDLVFQDCIGYDSGMLWSGEGTSLSNYEWQQMDDLGNFLSQDQTLRSESANLWTENSGFFDLSAYEYYSTP